MTQFSANLGFLWTELSLPDAIHAAADAGFVAVECHWPYETSAEMVREALLQTGLPMLGINTARGQEGEFGFSALPERQDDARQAIDEAIGYARRIDAHAIHVMAGFASGAEAHATFVANLRYAASAAAAHGITILIEPLNPHDAPGYFLNSTDQAEAILREVARDNIKLMFDCYHVARTEGDVLDRLTRLFPLIGHIQIASVPDRGEPGCGDLDYRAVFTLLETLGWTTPIGAEYKPAAATQDGLAWMRDLQPLDA